MLGAMNTVRCPQPAGSRPFSASTKDDGQGPARPGPVSIRLAYGILPPFFPNAAGQCEILCQVSAKTLPPVAQKSHFEGAFRVAAVALHFLRLGSTKISPQCTCTHVRIIFDHGMLESWSRDAHQVCSTEYLVQKHSE